MTIVSLQKLLSIPLFFLGSCFLFATEQPSIPIIYVGPQTLVVGFETVHLLNADSENISAPDQSAAIIYISANTVFTAPEELLQQVVVLKKSEDKVLRNAIKNQPATHKTITSAKAKNTIDKCLMPFGTVPNQHQKNIITSIRVSPLLLNSKIKVNHSRGTTIFLIFLQSTPQYQKIFFGHQQHFEFPDELRAKTTRPPPFVG